ARRQQREWGECSSRRNSPSVAPLQRQRRCFAVSGRRKQQHPPGEEVRRVSFRWLALGRRRRPTYSSSPGRRIGLDEISSPSKGETVRKQRPPGAAGSGGRRFGGQPQGGGGG